MPYYELFVRREDAIRVDEKSRMLNCPNTSPFLIGFQGRLLLISLEFNQTIEKYFQQNCFVQQSSQVLAFFHLKIWPQKFKRRAVKDLWNVFKGISLNLL